MSHFTVLVISKSPDDVDDLLAPFHEFECTGENDEYIQEVDETEYALELKVEEGQTQLDYICGYYGYEVIKHDETPDVDGEHKFGYVQLNEQGEIAKVVRRTNPNAKWDWYVIGGRWGGMFQPGSRDQIQRSNLDLVEMLEESRKERRDLWLKAVDEYTKTGGTEATFVSERNRYSELLKVLKAEESSVPLYKRIDEHQEAKELRSNINRYDLLYGIPLECQSIDEYVAGAVPFSTFAVLTEDGKWYERGEMGWWGMAFNEKDKDEWNRETYKMLNSIPDDRWLTMVDCHI